jgi:hypothetical protein
MKRVMMLTAGFALAALMNGWAGQQGGGTTPRAGGKFFPVKPVAAAPGSSLSTTASTSATLRIGNGRFFSYALPPGWHVGEDGQFALTLVAPDNKAMTVMVGNAGMQPNYPPARYVQEKLMALRPQNLQMGAPRAARPVAGFAQAVEFDVSYSVVGPLLRGVAKCNIQPAYDSATMAMTVAVAEAGQWPGYSSWLPQVADQISALNGAAFGARGVMAQNLANSKEFGEAAQRYREASARIQQGVTDARDASQQKQAAGMRDMLGSSQAYSDPYENKRVELPLTYQDYWTDRQGNYVRTDDPSANPNVGSTGDWRALKRAQ